jgi:hypothetical protein
MKCVPPGYFSERSAGSLNSARTGALAGSPQGQAAGALTNDKGEIASLSGAGE